MGARQRPLLKIVRHFRISEEHAGQRIDRFLCDQLESVGRKLAGILCSNGNVRVNGRRVRKSHELTLGSLVEVQAPPLGHASVSPEIPFEIVLCTEDYVVVEKPAGVPTGALLGKESGTMAGALLAHYPEMASVGYGAREPGVVHRLDNFTSGLLLAARNQPTFELLKEALSAGKIEKHYLAVVAAGTLGESGEVTARLISDPQNSKRVIRASSTSGYAAHTIYNVIERGEVFDLVEAKAHAAFRHQIRFHLALEGGPLVGDTLYGGAVEGAPRHALHASGISGSIPGLPAFAASSPLPQDLRALLNQTKNKGFSLSNH